LTSYFLCSHCKGQGTIDHINDEGHVLSSSVCLYCNGTKIPAFFQDKIRWVFLGTTVKTRQGLFLLGQCRELGIPAYVEQLGTWFKGTRGKAAKRDPNGSVLEEWPEKLRVRELPSGLLPGGWVHPSDDKAEIVPAEQEETAIAPFHRRPSGANGKSKKGEQTGKSSKKGTRTVTT
jgi:hypothetical protein